jgi:mRNA-degrading endonuclease toxin of MazEF toxin-antitoxin module
VTSAFIGLSTIFGNSDNIRDNVTTVLRSRLIRRIGPLTPDKLRVVEDALRFALAL